MHSMDSFFSGTDWDNLHDRSLVSNYFLMLIVNFSGKWCAKVAFKAKKEGDKGVKLSLANNSDGFKPLKIDGKKSDDVLAVMDCKIEIENESVDEKFEKRWENVKNTKKEEEKRREQEREKRYSGGRSYSPPATTYKQWKQGRMWDDSTLGEWEKEDGVWRMKDKKVSEMTEREWIEHENGVDKFTIKHAKAYLNSILDGTYMPTDFSDCIKKIEHQQSQFINVMDFNRWIEEFETLLQEHFDVLFIGKNQNDYIDLMHEVRDYLLPYSTHNELIRAMVESVSDEIELYKEPIM